MKKSDSFITMKNKFKQMKKIHFIILMFGLITMSCKDSFIDLTPEDQQSSASFFKTEQHFRQGLVASYTPLRGLLDNDYFLAEMRSDNTHYERSVTRGTAFEMRDNIADFANDEGNNYVYNVYKSCYNGIASANIVINRIQESDISEAAKEDIEGQAKFLRAYNYFKLVRYFGGVPLFLKEVTNAEEAFLPRSTADEVYAQIISDAQDAITKLKPPAKFPQSGEATKGSATMLLAEVYMTLKKYPEAETLLLTLKPMGYKLLGTYASVFSTANKNSTESIFEVQYLQGVQAGQQSNFIYLFLPRSPNNKLITGVATANQAAGGYNTPTSDIINAYEPDDKRKDASIAVAEGTYNGSGYMTYSANKSIINYTPAAGKIGVPYIKKYLNPHTDINNTDDNWPVYRYADALLLLAEAQNEQGKSPLSSLNEVRVRAGLLPSDETDQSKLRDIIAHERRVELAFENHRWHDLVRTGKAIEVMTAYGIKQKQKYSYLRPDSYIITPAKLLYPIPRREIELNPMLTQNPL
jgi:hypothetical protein